MFADAYIKSLGYLWYHLNFRTLQEPNFVCLSLKSTVLLFALDSAHVKLDIWNSPLQVTTGQTLAPSVAQDIQSCISGKLMKRKTILTVFNYTGF